MSPCLPMFSLSELMRESVKVASAIESSRETSGNCRRKPLLECWNVGMIGMLLVFIRCVISNSLGIGLGNKTKFLLYVQASQAPPPSVTRNMAYLSIWKCPFREPSLLLGPALSGRLYVPLLAHGRFFRSNLSSNVSCPLQQLLSPFVWRTISSCLIFSSPSFQSGGECFLVLKSSGRIL